MKTNPKILMVAWTVSNCYYVPLELLLAWRVREPMLQQLPLLILHNDSRTVCLDWGVRLFCTVQSPFIQWIQTRHRWIVKWNPLPLQYPTDPLQPSTAFNIKQYYSSLCIFWYLAAWSNAADTDYCQLCYV